MGASREVEIYQVDAFTDVVFGGNPAGVVPDATGLDEDTMQKIAREMNLSETAFVLDLREKPKAPTEESSPSPDFDVRFFTPVAEVNLCGHATIGTFWLLAELGVIQPKDASFEQDGEVRAYQRTKAGVLPVDIVFRGGPSRVMMTQAVPKRLGELTDAEVIELEAILSAPPGAVRGFERSRPQVVSTGLPDLIVPVVSREALWAMRPNMAGLSDFCKKRGIISAHCFTFETVTPEATVHCRDFSPAVGVPEESATGTASGATAAYLVMNELICVSGDITEIVCEQGYILGRPSRIFVEVRGEPGAPKTVRVGGSARILMKGIMKLD